MSMRSYLMVAGIAWFAYSLAVTFGLQLLVIPHFLPQYDLGHGLFVPDSIGFHEIAKDKAIEIRNSGWGAWELRPKGFSPAGISAAFYAIWTSEPYCVLPFNALVHAASGCVVLWLLLGQYGRASATFGATLFVVNPSALEWVAQIHRDGLFILGNLLVIVCLVRLGRGAGSAHPRDLLGSLVWGVVGTLLVWVSRPYWMQVLIASAIICGILIVGRTSGRGWSAAGRTFRIVLTIASLNFLQWTLAGIDVNPALAIDRGHLTVEQQMPPIGGDADTNARRIGGEPQWRRTEGVSTIVENKLLQLASVRHGVIKSGGKSLVDADVELESVADFFAYLPRAAQLGILSPLPELWTGEGSTAAATSARKIVGAATSVFYVFLAFLALRLTVLLRRLEFVLIFVFCISAILVYGFTYPNIGTLLRFRYGFYMLIIGFGAAAAFESATGWWAKRRRRVSATT